MQRPLAHALLAEAVHNNAVWCDAVCRTHGLAGEFLEGIWIARGVTPPFYPNAVTLVDGRADDQIACLHTLIDADIPGAWALKDSFCSLDLTPLGFRRLFGATWFGLSSGKARPKADLAGIRWSKVGSPEELAEWEATWRGEPTGTSQRIFLPALLTDDAIAVIAVDQDHRTIAGAIANRTGNVVGLSNIFLPPQDDDQFRAACVAAVMELFPELPIVGYTSGNQLDAWGTLGFEELGPLRIWERPDPSG